jgi:hypothetical protein
MRPPVFTNVAHGLSFDEASPPARAWRGIFAHGIMEHFTRFLRELALAVVLVGASGCASVLPRYATEGEAIAARGAPTMRWDNGDGTFTLEYATQPEGTSCLMVRVDTAGQVLGLWDALADENLDRIKPGMNKDEVARLLGARRSERIFPRSGDEVWDWKIAHDGTLFNVRFVADKVRNTARVYPHPRYYRDWYWEPVFYPATAIYFWSLDWRFYGHRWHGAWRHGGRHPGSGRRSR